MRKILQETGRSVKSSPTTHENDLKERAVVGCGAPLDARH